MKVSVESITVTITKKEGLQILNGFSEGKLEMKTDPLFEGAKNLKHLLEGCFENHKAGIHYPYGD